MSIVVEEAEFSTRGVKTRLLGFILMLLGVLDSLLTLRGGVPAYEFLLLIVLGAVPSSFASLRSDWTFRRYR